MGSKSAGFENQLLLLLFNNTAIANIGSAAGLPASSAAGNLYLRLYTSAVVVGETTLGTECAYTGYVQYGIAVPRNSTNWQVSNENVSNKLAVAFGLCTAGTEIIRYFAIWRNNTSNVETQRCFWGQLAEDFVVSPGITPEFDIGTITVNED